MAAPKLKWKKIGDQQWESTDGRYEVWLQSRLLNGEKEWAAKYTKQPRNHITGQTPWLCECADSRADAIEVCQEHADREKD